MSYALILAAALHVLSTMFWAGTTFALARTGGVAAERLFKPQLAAALLAFVSGGYLGHTLHGHAFGRPEQLLGAAIAASAIALLVQASTVGRAMRALRGGTDSEAVAARGRATTAHRLAAALLALAAVGMVAARYLPPSSTAAADTAAPSQALESRPGSVPAPTGDCEPAREAIVTASWRQQTDA